MDVAIAFGWTLGTVFHLCSDAIVFIMAKQDVKLNCYIDDYVAVVPRARAENVFQCLRTLLEELGLPVNLKNLFLPQKDSHVWVLRWTLRLMSYVLPLTSYMKFTKSAFWFARKHILLKTTSNPFGKAVIHIEMC